VSATASRSTWTPLAALLGVFLSRFSSFLEAFCSPDAYIPSRFPFVAEPLLTSTPSQFFLAESPRYLIKAGKPEKAAANLCWLRNLEPTHPYIEEELAATIIEINREREITFGLKGGKVARYFRGLWNEASAKVRHPSHEEEMR
jgi:hypothetical protein